MLREFTKDVGKRFKRGDVRDYPTQTWRSIANDAGEDLDDITKEIDPRKKPIYGTAMRRRQTH